MQDCAGFISADLLYMFRASDAHHQEYLKTGKAATDTGVMVAGRSSHHHVRDERRFVPYMQGPPCQFLNTPDDGRLKPETCRVSLQK